MSIFTRIVRSACAFIPPTIYPLRPICTAGRACCPFGGRSAHLRGSHRVPAFRGQRRHYFPNQLHSLETVSHSRILLCIFDDDCCHSYQQYFQKCNPLRSLIPSCAISCHGNAAIKGLLSLALDFPTKEGLIPKSVLALAEGYLTLLLADLFPKLTLEPKNISMDLILEQRILMYIDAHYTESLSWKFCPGNSVSAVSASPGFFPTNSIPLFHAM